ncbi:pseudouridine synthase, partial [bacterium]|nr:pseudouridine synthase [bacterium]
MRLNKYIAQSGVASRRKADQLTINGAVRINGQVMKEPGYDVQPE